MGKSLGVHQVMPFGKYKGQQLWELPRHYLEWAAENLTGLGSGLRAGLREALAMADEKVCARTSGMPEVLAHTFSGRAARPIAPGTLDKDDLLPLTTAWLGDLVANVGPDGRVPVRVAHETLLAALGLDHFQPAHLTLGRQ